MAIDRPLMAGGVSVGLRRVRVTSVFGVANFETWRPRRLQREFGRWDGTQLTADLRETSKLDRDAFDQALTALDEIGALADATAVWRLARRFAGNPSPVPLSGDPDQAYSIPRRDFSGPVEARESTRREGVHLVGEKRASAALSSDAVDPARAASLAFEACTKASDPQVRPVASAGNLRPTHLVLVEGRSQGGGLRALAFTDTGSTEIGTMRSEEFREAFVHDPGLDSALAAGASVILVCADPRRGTARYGNRAWSFCELEAGAYAHHLSLLLTESNCGHRAIGGFFERPLLEVVGLLDTGLEPVLTIVVTGGSMGS